MLRESENAPTSPRPSPPTFAYPSVAGRSLRSLGSGAERESKPAPLAFPLRPPGGGGQGEVGLPSASLFPVRVTVYPGAIPPVPLESHLIPANPTYPTYPTYPTSSRFIPANPT